MMNINELPTLPITAEELASRILGHNPKHSQFVLHVLPVEELLTSILRNSDAYLTPASLQADGIRVYFHQSSYWVTDRGNGTLIDKRIFQSMDDCYRYVLMLFRRFLAKEFAQFSYGLDSTHFPLQWRYSAELTLQLLSQTLLNPDPVRCVPLRPMPKLSDVMELLLPQEARLLSDKISDGSHIQKTQSGYTIRSFERGFKYHESSYSSFKEALETYLKPWLEPSARSLRRFENINDFEFNPNVLDPPT